MEIVWEAALAVLLQPVVVIEARAYFLDRGTDRVLLAGERKIHVRPPLPSCV
jgi:hypothetical protein